MKKNSLILLLFCFSFCNHAFAQTKKESLYSFIKNTVDSIYDKDKLPGVFAGILDNGERHFFNAGFADPEKQMPFDSATVFEIGSITKTFTAYVLTAVLMENKIAETDPIIKFLPDSVQQNQQLASISFLNLMNHTSGLPRLPDNMKAANSRQPYEDYSTADLFAYLQGCTVKPDGKTNYSNLGAGIAGILAERIAGRSYAALLDKYLLIPYKMQTTALNDINANRNKSQGYFAKDDKTGYWNMNSLVAAGGIRSSAADMLSYLQNMGAPKTTIAKQITEKLTAQTIALNPRITIGRGWHIFNDNDKPVFYWHNGGTYGFSTFCAFTKDKSKAVIVVINQFNKNGQADALGASIIKKLISEE